jgi:hypothetical protein
MGHMRKLIDKVKPTPTTGIGASVMQLGLHKTDEYIDDIVTEEYNFQRESLYTPQTPPQLIAGSLLVAALAGFIVTNDSKFTGPNAQNLQIFVSIFIFSLLVLIISGTLLIRRKYSKVDNFAIEKELLDTYQDEVASLGEQSNQREETDILILTKLQTRKVKLLRDQIILCRGENRYRHNVQIVMTLAILVALLTGGVVATAIAVSAH